MISWPELLDTAAPHRAYRFALLSIQLRRGADSIERLFLTAATQGFLPAVVQLLQN